MSNDFNKRPIIVLDFETSGDWAHLHDIIEIGAIAVDHQLNELRRYEQKVHILNQETVQPEALAVNGYNAEVWGRDGVSINFAIATFELWARDGIFAGWNITLEDRFLCATYQRLVWKNPFLDRRYGHKIDIPSIAWYVLGAAAGGVSSLDYDTTSRALGVEPEPKPHRAIGGAEHDLALLRALRERLPK